MPALQAVSDCFAGLLASLGGRHCRTLDRAAQFYCCITNDHKLSGLKLHKFIISLWIKSLACFS